MFNWDYDLTKVNKNDPNFIRWRLERLINYGLGGEKLNADLLKEYWTKLKIDPLKKACLKDMLWTPK